jgi:integrase
MGALGYGKGPITIKSTRTGHRTKSKKSRVVLMPPRLKVALAEHALQFRNAEYDGMTSPWVFHHALNRRRARAGDRIGSLHRAFKAVERAGLPEELHPRDLRHTKITDWLADGASPVHVREAVGHSDLRTTCATRI